ncbi:MAG: hypothetical protein KUG79_05205 [Pseudomonadales bacterium]|nr:hypothetical protein [Pseudomonadales bacterium]
MLLKTGARLGSSVCNAEVMVISAPDGDAELTCGGAAMAEAGAGGDKGTVSPDHSGGVQIGKRYVDADGTIELLCVKPGEGSLALNGTALALKDAKKLPKTD